MDVFIMWYTYLNDLKFTNFFIGLLFIFEQCPLRYLSLWYSEEASCRVGPFVLAFCMPCLGFGVVSSSLLLHCAIGFALIGWIYLRTSAFL